MKKTEIFIVDKQADYRLDLRNLLSTYTDFAVTGEASSSNELISALQQNIPDLVIMDISMPGMTGMEATKMLLGNSPNTRVIALTIHTGKQFVKDMLDAGASGYLLKKNAPEELPRAIRNVMKGDIYLDSAITSIALSTLETSNEPDKPAILRTKLHRPPLTNDIIVRKRIINILNSNRNKPFSLVAAPAGYGKSMAVSQWLEDSGLHSSWISLDEEHNDIRMFLIYLQSAIEKIFPGALQKSGNMFHAPNLPPLKAITHSVINELDCIEQDFVLVLDDYHSIKQDEIHQFVNELLKYPPEHMHLSILTRVDPPLIINSLLVNDRMNHLRMKDLAFNEKEIAALFMKINDVQLDENDAGEFLNKTEGWIVGLRMAFLSIINKEDASNIIASMKGDIHSLSQFLIEEVLKKQPQGIQDMLYKTSILDRFSSGLIDAIYPNKDIQDQLSGEEFIQWLIKSNLFIVSLDDQKEWFRYHHMIQDLLQTRLLKEANVPDIGKIHRMASQWFEQNKFYEEAIRHMMTAEKPEMAADIIERHRMAKLDDDKWYILQRWLEMLPVEIINERPQLLLSEAWGAYEDFQLGKIPALIEKAKAHLSNDKKDQAFLGECSLLLGLVYHWSGLGEEALLQFQNAKDLLPDSGKLALGMLHLHIALSRGATGKKDLAIRDLNKLLSEGQRDAVYLTRLMAGLFYVNQFAGNLLKSKDASQRIKALASKYEIVYTHAMGVCMEATSCFNLYQLKEALQLFTQAGKMRYILHNATAMDALAGKAISHQLLHQSKEAEQALAELENFEMESNPTGPHLISLSCRARIHLLRGELAQAMKIERELIQEPSFAGLFVWIEIPILSRLRVLIANGSPESLSKADELLHNFLAASRKYHLVNQEIEALVLKSLLLKKQAHKERALTCLGEVLALSGSQWIRPFAEAGQEIKSMLNELLSRDIAVHTIRTILKSFSEDSKTGSTVRHAAYTSPNPKNLVTLREIEIIKMMSKGLRNKEIAGLLFVAEGTIKKHIYNICQKWDVGSRISLLNLARQYGIIEEV